MSHVIINFIVNKDGLIPQNDGEREKLKGLFAIFKEGDIVQAFFEKVTDDGSLGQLAKIHACIKDLATFTGNNFDTIKKEVKSRAGLIIRKKTDKRVIEVVKSFSVCSKDELALAIQSCIELGAEYDYIFL